MKRPGGFDDEHPVSDHLGVSWSQAGQRQPNNVQVHLDQPAQTAAKQMTAKQTRAEQTKRKRAQAQSLHTEKQREQHTQVEEARNSQAYSVAAKLSQVATASSDHLTDVTDSASGARDTEISYSQSESENTALSRKGLFGGMKARSNKKNTVGNSVEINETDPPVIPETSIVTRSDSTEVNNGVRAAEAHLREAERNRRLREKRERKRFTSHTRKRRKRWFISLVAVLAVAVFVLLGVLTPVMAVREVEVLGLERVNGDDLQTALARFEGTPLALVDDEQVRESLVPFPLIERYSIERIPPHTLRIEIEERVPVIALERNGQFEIFDTAGVLLSRESERPSDVPVGDASLGDPLSEQFAAAGGVVRNLPENLRSQIVRVSAPSAQDVRFTLGSGTEVTWGEANRTNEKAAVLAALLGTVGAVSVIDLSAPETPVFQ